MIATNMCSNFGGFRCIPPIIRWSGIKYIINLNEINSTMLECLVKKVKIHI